MAKTTSGLSWVARFPSSTSTDDLTEPFRTSATEFISALETAGAIVSIKATLRPKERAYLMHWSFRIAREGFDPERVPAMEGVDIDWVHRDGSGDPNLPVSRTNAGQMVTGYDIAYPPALASRHTEGLAIDMVVSWTAAELTIEGFDGKAATIRSGARDGSNSELQKVGKGYGVVKLASDPPHWSSDGH